MFADFDEKGAQEAAEKSKSFATNSHFRTMALRVDVTDPSSVQSMVDATVKEFGRIDYNVNSAGVRTLIYMKSLYRTKREQELMSAEFARSEWTPTTL